MCIEDSQGNHLNEEQQYFLSQHFIIEKYQSIVSFHSGLLCNLCCTFYICVFVCAFSVGLCLCVWCGLFSCVSYMLCVPKCIFCVSVLC